MNEQSILRGITNADLKQVVSKAFRCGWKVRNATGARVVIDYPGKNGHVSFSPTNGSIGIHKEVAKSIHRISGHQLVQPTSKRRSRKKVQASGFVKTYQTPKQRELTQWIESLTRRHKRVALELKILSMGGIDHCDTVVATALIKELMRLEDWLHDYKQPLPELNLATMND